MPSNHKIRISIKYEHAQYYPEGLTSRWKFLFLCLFFSKFVMFFCNAMKSLHFPFPNIEVQKASSQSQTNVDLVSYISIYISFLQAYLCVHKILILPLDSTPLTVLSHVFLGQVTCQSKLGFWSLVWWVKDPLRESQQIFPCILIRWTSDLEMGKR